MTQCDYPRATLESFKKYETVAKLQPGWRGFILRHKKSMQELVLYGEFVKWSAPSGVYTLLSAGEFSMLTIRRRVLADNEVYESSVSILVFLESLCGDLLRDNELFGREIEAHRAMLDDAQYELYLKMGEIYRQPRSFVPKPRKMKPEVFAARKREQEEEEIRWRLREEVSARNSLQRNRFFRRL